MTSNAGADPKDSGDQVERERSERIRQIIDDCLSRRAEGEAVPDESILEAHPDLLPELADELRYLRIIVAAKRRADETHSVGLHIRCPHCHHPVEIVEETELTEVVCSSCGSNFSLLSKGTEETTVAAPKSLGRFLLLEKLGTGACGSVWKAHDTQLERIVAVKIPRHSQLESDELERFVREARSAASLSHPNIVSVHEVGRQDDQVYIVSDFVEGTDLARWLENQHAAPREAAELCVKLAEALQHAHERGIIHRDLKPSNIMLDGDGQPHLMDFGLAKREAGETTMTVEGRLLGTPAYMSPEQARGEAHLADERSDVYSLGVVLFELLTGERPFRGSPSMLLRQVCTEEPPSPRKLNDKVPRDLAYICLKCLEKSPANRYRTPKALGDDLQSFMNGEPTIARSVSETVRGWRWCQRHPTRTFLLAIAMLVVIAAPMASLRLGIVASELAWRVPWSRDTLGNPSLTVGSVETVRLFNFTALSSALAIATTISCFAAWKCTRRWHMLRFVVIAFLIGCTSIIVLRVGAEFVRTRTMQRGVDLVLASGGHVAWQSTWETDSALFNTIDRRIVPFTLRRLLGDCMFSVPKRVRVGRVRTRQDFADIWNSGFVSMSMDFTVDHNRVFSDFAALSRFAPQELRRQTQTSELTLTGANVTDELIPNLEKLLGLKRLTLVDTSVTDAGLLHLGRLAKLESLELTGANFTDAHLKHLGGLPNLAMLKLDNTSITDAGLEQLAQLRGLWGLSVSRMPVSDVGIQPLIGSKSLESLALNGTDVTVKGIMWLRRRAPHLDIRSWSQRCILSYDRSFVVCFRKRQDRTRVGLRDETVNLTGFHNVDSQAKFMIRNGRIQFDVNNRLIQIGGGVSEARSVPDAVMGLPVAGKIGQIHFLHGTNQSHDAPIGTVVGKYVLHYRDGATRERPLVLGTDILDCFGASPEPNAISRTGDSGDDVDAGKLKRDIVLLQHTEWGNPRPDVEIESLDFVTVGDTGAPLLFAAIVLELAPNAN